MRADLLASDRLGFDTRAYPADEAFDRYRDFYGLGTRVSRTGPDVRATIDSWRLDRMLMHHRRLNDVAHERDIEQIRHDGFTHFVATLVLGGAFQCETGEALYRLAPGEVIVMDTSIPARNRMCHAEIVTLAIAREQMAVIAGDVDGLNGHVLSADHARLFREFVESLIRNLPEMADHAIFATSGVLTTLLSIAIDSSGFDRNSADAPRDLTRSKQLKQFRRWIDSRLDDPAFDAAAAVRESGLSRATLYRLVRSEGGLAAFLRDRRLERVRKLLADPTDDRPVADLVHVAGLPSVSHASRVFLDRYRVRPAQYRQIIRAGSGDDAFYKFRMWLDEVR